MNNTVFLLSLKCLTLSPFWRTLLLQKYLCCPKIFPAYSWETKYFIQDHIFRSGFCNFSFPTSSLLRSWKTGFLRHFSSTVSLPTYLLRFVHWFLVSQHQNYQDHHNRVDPCCVLIHQSCHLLSTNKATVHSLLAHLVCKHLLSFSCAWIWLWKYFFQILRLSLLMTAQVAVNWQFTKTASSRWMKFSSFISSKNQLLSSINYAYW